MLIPRKNVLTFLLYFEFHGIQFFLGVILLCILNSLQFFKPCVIIVMSFFLLQKMENSDINFVMYIFSQSYRRYKYGTRNDAYMTVIYFFLSGFAISLQRRNQQFISQKAMEKILFLFCIHTVILRFLDLSAFV